MKYNFLNLSLIEDLENVSKLYFFLDSYGKTIQKIYERLCSSHRS